MGVRPGFFAVCLAGCLLSAASRPSFDTAVRPILAESCAGCHNGQLRSGNLSISDYLDERSLTTDTGAWNRILARIEAGEMPPKGAPRPSAAALATLTEFVRSALTASAPRSPLTHRLNRSEYANTVRDVLGVDFSADDEFPPDDSVYGFDNIGGVLTVSPALMQRYLSTAEKIASRAIGGDSLPPPGFVKKPDRLRSAGPGAIEMKDIVDYDAEYIVRVNLNGHRAGAAKPVTLQVSVDGKPVKTVSVDVRISDVNRQGGNTERRIEEARVFLTANEHTFRAEFLHDDFVKDLGDRALANPHSNIFPESFEIGGPYAPVQPHSVAKKILLCDPATGAACVRRILTEFAHHAYRRPATAAEIADLVAIHNKAAASGYSPRQSLQFAIAAALVKPQFLYRVESDSALGDLGLASRLSYFLWSSCPDEELLSLAESNQLHLPAILGTQVKRMLADPRSLALADNFAGQWLQTRGLDAVRPDANKFPDWNPTLKDEMRTETRLFFDAIVRDNRPIQELIDGSYTFLNEHLADYYGIAGVAGSVFRRVELKGADAARRGGVFTQASVLTATSYPTRTSVVLRGKYLLETVLNAPPPPPPPDVPPLDEKTVGVARSLRQQMEVHRADPVCASCHSKMDALGFALENYDAIGRWRITDGRFPIDASGTLPDGRSFRGPVEMKSLLRENMPEFVHTLAEKLLTYALGRGIERNDGPALEQIVRETEAEGNRFQALIFAIVRSAPFKRQNVPNLIH